MAYDESHMTYDLAYDESYLTYDEQDEEDGETAVLLLLRRAVFGQTRQQLLGGGRRGRHRGVHCRCVDTRAVGMSAIKININF